MLTDKTSLLVVQIKPHTEAICTATATAGFKNETTGAPTLLQGMKLYNNSHVDFKIEKGARYLCSVQKDIVFHSRVGHKWKKNHSFGVTARTCTL